VGVVVGSSDREEREKEERTSSDPGNKHSPWGSHYHKVKAVSLLLCQSMNFGMRLAISQESKVIPSV
jgi:hypothetical protein